MEKRGLGWRTVQLVIGVISRPGIGDLLKTSHPTGFRQRLMQLRKEYQSVLCRRRRRRIAASHRQQNIRFFPLYNDDDDEKPNPIRRVVINC